MYVTFKLMTQMVRLLNIMVQFSGAPLEILESDNFLKKRIICVQAQLNFERNFQTKKYNRITSDNIEIKMSVNTFIL